ncbi:MAG: ATP phosphoribosyltransferase (ATP-PRTase) (ATP-PRT) [Candelina submexicana]|nr:MAG: ATP phosphoribosyltransferase (ATP-PRTase) (ATP-PRT) [Candelina submexicana]
MSFPQITDTLKSLEGRLLFAVPKKALQEKLILPDLEGRLQQAVLDLLHGSDIQFHRHSRLDIALVQELDIALVFLPAADIPTFVGEGKVDLGITGRDQVAEHEAVTPATEHTGVEEVLDLGFGRCRLQVQVPEKGRLKEARNLVGKNVCTSFVNLATAYFERLEGLEDTETPVNGDGVGKRQLKTKIKYVGGSVEAACALGVADGVVDLVGEFNKKTQSTHTPEILTHKFYIIESGETMKAAGLIAIDTVVESTAILIKSKSPTRPELVNLIAERIKGVITAQKYVLCQYNIPRPLLEAAKRITPGKRAPTINALEEEGWVAVSSMVEQRKKARVMDELTKVGATDILILNIANSRTG